MNVAEKNVDLVVEALVERIRSLEVDVWYRDKKIADLTAENEKIKGEHKNETV